jgi:CheY-like chemotaxis protein
VVAETVSAASADPVDVLLLDLGLPDGDGLTVLAELAKLDALPRVSVALTGRDEPEVIARCRAAGCTDVLLKPVPVAELLRKSREWLAAPTTK